MEGKICTKCGEFKSYSEFYKDKHKKYGYKSQCKQCVNENHKQYYESHKEERKEYLKQYRDSHKEEIKEKSKQYRDSHKEEIKEYQKQYRDSHKEELKMKLN